MTVLKAFLGREFHQINNPLHTTTTQLDRTHNLGVGCQQAARRCTDDGFKRLGARGKLGVEHQCDEHQCVCEQRVDREQLWNELGVRLP